MKRRKLGRKGIRLRNNLIIISILSVIAISIYMIINKYPKENMQIQYAKQTQQLLQASDDIQNSTEGTTYYISSQGTSTEGTDINDPMPLKTANTKTYNGNDKILFKAGDTFYGTVNFNIQASENEYAYIGSYGEGEKPIISGAKIVSKEEACESVDNYNDIYKIDLSDKNNFDGIDITNDSSCNVGFISDMQNNIYGNRKKSLDLLEEDMDFYCDTTNLYIKCSENPIKKFKTLKVATNIQLFKVSCNTIVNGLKLMYTGAHAIVKRSYPIKNVYISNCVIENIGGSVQNLNKFIRYGNAIEFWCGAENVLLEKNIIKNVYDAAITLQGDDHKFCNINIRDNIVIESCYSFELWASGKSGGMNEVKVYNNITINQGRGWGQEVRPNPYNSAEYVFYDYANDADMDINIYNNSYYNSTRLYYVLYSIKDRFRQEIKIDNNKFRKQEDIYVVNDNKDTQVKEFLNKEYNIDQNSNFRLLTPQDLTQINNQAILASNSYDEIKTYYENLEKNFHYEDTIAPIQEKYTQFKTQNQSIINQIQGLSAQIDKQETYLKQINAENITEQELINHIKETYKIGSTILDAYINNKLDITEDELITIMQQIDTICKSYNDLYNLLQPEQTADLTETQNKITNMENEITKYEIIGLEQITNIINNCTETMESNIHDVVKNISVTNMLDWADTLFDIDVINYVTKNPPTIKYSTTELTNQNVTATVVADYEIKITNNNNSPTYIFQKNDRFTFQYTIRNKPDQITAVVYNIDKTPPNIKEVENGKIYTTSVTPIIEDSNLQTITLKIYGQEDKNYEKNTAIVEEGEYNLTAIDEAGNQTTIEFEIIKENDGKYRINKEMITNIQVDTELEKFKENLSIKTEYSIKHKGAEIKKDDKISTGDVLETKGGTKYTLVVNGDTTGDGKADIKDIFAINKHRLNKAHLENEYFQAGDVNKDGKVDIKDIFKINKFRLGKINSL